MNRLNQPVDLRKTMQCEDCGHEGRPLLRLWGYPTEEALRSAEQGRIALMGCVFEHDPAPYECRYCGVDTRVEGVQPY